MLKLMVVTTMLVLGLVAMADAHGSLLSPRSRNEIFFSGDWSSTAGNGIGTKTCPNGPFGAPPGFCLPAGKPGQQRHHSRLRC